MTVTSEAITGTYNKTLARSYDSLGRSSGMNIGTEYDVDYGYDAVGRFSTVTNGSDVFTYSYLSSSNLIAGIAYPNTISITKSYESNRDLVTSIENKYGTTTISKYDYSNDDLGRRTAMGKSGTAFTQADSIAYGYNDKSEVTSAVATNQATYNYGFNFDAVGNRMTSTSSETGTAVTRTYTANQLNQYTAINNPSQSPTYNDDGCMANDGTWTFSWDGENRLLAAEKSGQRLEFKYDYMSRRVEKRVLDGSSETSKERFVYDGFKQIERLNALDSNAIVQKFVWSGETMLAMGDTNGVYYYSQDANKNISELLASDGTIKAHYEYSPFGKVVVANGDLADDNPFRFSSEFTDDESGLVYYNYRYYSPELGRWLSRDPIGEKGGWNLYVVIDNNAVNKWDEIGLSEGSTIKELLKLLIPSVFPSGSITILTVTISIERHGGCFWRCTSITPTELLGAGTTVLEFGEGQSPFYGGIGGPLGGRRGDASIGTSGGNLEVAIGVPGVGLPVTLSVRTDCVRINKNSLFPPFCPCTDEAPLTYKGK